MKIVIPLYQRFTALDAVGPYEVLSRLPDAEVVFAATEPGHIATDSGVLTMLAETRLADVTEADIVMVPGGPGVPDMLADQPLIDWIRDIHPTTTWTTSVCTGSLLLGAAGVLEGLEATSHWMALDFLPAFGASPTPQRVVVQGKVVTAAGVSSGIDMALTLASMIHGDDVAQAIQLGIEYDPQPPFDAGSPAKAGETIVQAARDALAAAL